MSLHRKVPLALAFVFLLGCEAGGVSSQPGRLLSTPTQNGKIVFGSDRDGRFRLYTMEPDGSDLAPLSSGLRSENHAAWSPDGSELAIVGKRKRGTSSAVYVMNVSGGSFAWSPDGDQIAFLSNRDGNSEIYVMDGC